MWIDDLEGLDELPDNEAEIVMASRTRKEAAETHRRNHLTVHQVVKGFVDHDTNPLAHENLIVSHPDVEDHSTMGLVTSEEFLEHLGTDHGIVPKFPAYIPSGIGQVYNGNGYSSGSNRTTGTTLNQLIAGGPLYSGPTGLVLDRWDVVITTIGAAGAIYRMGIWTVDDQSDPFKVVNNVRYGTLLREILDPAGNPVDATVAGVRQITPTVPVTVPADIWFVVGGVSQVAVCQPTIGNSASMFTPMGQSNPSSGVLSTTSWPVQTGVSGALGDFIPQSVLSNIGHGVGFRRSA